MDADFSHDPGALPELVAPLAEGYELVDRLRGTSRGDRSPTGPGSRHLLSLGRQPLRLGRARARGGRLDRRLPGLRGVGAPAARPRPHPGRGLRLPDRDDLPGQAGRGPDRPRCRSASWTGWPASPRCPGTIVVEALALVTWWGLGRCWHAVRRATAPSEQSRVPSAGRAASGAERAGHAGRAISAIMGRWDPRSSASWSSTTNRSSPTCSRRRCASRGSPSRWRPPEPRPWPRPGPSGPTW